MAFIPADEVMRAAFVFVDAQGNEAVNVQHFKGNDAPVTNTLMTALASVIEDWATEDWVDAASSQWRFDRVEIRDLTVEDGIYLTHSINVVGGVLVDPLPSSDTIAISLRTGMTGRSNRGRLYHVGLPETLAEGDYVTLAGAVTLANTYNALRSKLLAEDFRWGVVSYVNNGVPRTEGAFRVYTQVLLTDRKIDRQNRRRP